jgi:hypothetical protein
MVAFKYVVSEKLPPISYATLIDYYVLFSFMTAWLIIILQVRLRDPANPTSLPLSLDVERGGHSNGCRLFPIPPVPTWGWACSQCSPMSSAFRPHRRLTLGRAQC